MSNEHCIESLTVDGFDRHREELARVLNACVHDGASVNFIVPHSIDESRAFWKQKVRPGLADATRILLVVKSEDRIAGTVQLVFDTPPNQTHRADVSKLLVHPDFRSRGIGRALMVSLEEKASKIGRTLLTLDTAGAHAEKLYLSLGYAIAGIIPAYARDPIEDRLDPAIFMYKML